MNLRLKRPVRNRMDLIKRFKTVRDETFKIKNDKHNDETISENISDTVKKKNPIENITSNNTIEINKPMDSKEQYKFLDELDILLSEFKPKKKNKIKGGSVKLL